MLDDVLLLELTGAVTEEEHRSLVADAELEVKGLATLFIEALAGALYPNI